MKKTSSNKYTLHEIKTSNDKKKFTDVPVKIYKYTESWIRPLTNEIEAVFEPSKNKLFDNGEAIRWVLIDANNISVGRIAAFYNNNSNEQLSVGGCGFFECINEQGAANVMFNAAKEWLQLKGIEAMDGSINFGDRDKWWGILTDGFTAPVYGMNYNHPYYKELFENYGFKNYFNQYSYGRKIDPDTQTLTSGNAVIKKAIRIFQNSDYKFRHLEKADLKNIGDAFVTIYNKSWAGFNDVKPMTKEQGRHLIKEMKPIIDLKIITFAYYKDEPIGFYIQIPDLNQAIKHLNGSFNLWNKLKFLYLIKVKKVCTKALGIVFGVVPEHQGKGVESGLIETFCQTIIENKDTMNYRDVEFTWIGDFNPLMMKMMVSYVESKVLKTHVTFRYIFDRNKPFTRAPRVSRTRQSNKTS